MQVISRQLSTRTIAANSDQVIAYCALPTGAKLNNVWMECAITTGALVSVPSSHMYGVAGMVVRIDDPDGSYTWDQVWDGAVRKDIAVATAGAADIDSPSSSEPEFDVGLVDLEGIMGMTDEDDTQIFKRRKLVTWAGNPVGGNGTTSYIPTDYFKTHLKGGPRAGAPSGVMFGFSSPEMAETTVQQNIPVETQWLVLQFIDMFLEDMFKWNIGIGTEESGHPYQHGSDTIAQFLENAMWEPSGEAYLYGVTWYCTTKATFDVTIPGMRRVKVLSSDA